MLNKVKALLLGISVRWVEVDEGTLKQDSERERRLLSALDRLELKVDNLEPDTISKMFDNPEEVVEWLAEHPKAEIEIGYWHVDIGSSEFSDVDWERYDHPFVMNGVVEDFVKTRNADKWGCGWAFG